LVFFFSKNLIFNKIYTKEKSLQHKINTQSKFSLKNIYSFFFKPYIYKRKKYKLKKKTFLQLLYFKIYMRFLSTKKNQFKYHLLKPTKIMINSKKLIIKRNKIKQTKNFRKRIYKRRPKNKKI
jgi:hypothetical protein